MYQEEKIINGILHYRTRPNEDFKPYTLENLTGKVGMLKEEMQKQQQGYSEEEVVELLQWLTDDNSIYSIMYGHKKYRFSTNDKDFTSKEILKQFKNK